MYYEYNEVDEYGSLRHKNALDLNFKYLGNFKYQMPETYRSLIVDLSASGSTQHQILKNCLGQVCLKLSELENLQK